MSRAFGRIKKLIVALAAQNEYVSVRTICESLGENKTNKANLRVSVSRAISELQDAELIERVSVAHGRRNIPAVRIWPGEDTEN